MTYEQQALLYLVRLGIGNNSESGFDFTGVDWRKLVDSSFAQGVPAIAVDGLQNLYEAQPGLTLDIENPELEALKYEWFGEVFSCEEDYQRYQAAIAEFLKVCRGQKVKVLLLKGYGLSLNYPIPSHRPCGDVDVFLFGKGENINEIVEKQLNSTVDRSNPHHSVFSFGGFNFENHITLLDVERHKNHFSDEQVFQKLIAEGCDEIEVGGEKCFVPSVKLNSVYLLRHMAHHFAVEKITLRHILDWALFVKANASKIDWDFVYGYAENSGCTPFLNCLIGICVESLGFATEDFPVRKSDEKLQSRMLADILHPEFDEAIPDSTHTIRYAIAKTRRILTNRWKYRMVSDERIVVTIFNLAKKRIHI